MSRPRAAYNARISQVLPETGLHHIDVTSVGEGGQGPYSSVCTERHPGGVTRVEFGWEAHSFPPLGCVPHSLGRGLGRPAAAPRPRPEIQPPPGSHKPANGKERP